MSESRFIMQSEIARPTPDRLTSTLLDHYPAHTVSGGFGVRTQAGQGVWPSYNCLDLLTPTSICPDVEDAEKDFSSAAWQPAFEFAVYGGVECAAIGLDKADQMAEVKRVFEISQSKGVERALRNVRFAAHESDDNFEWDEPEDLTAGMGVSLVVALALLEGDAADKYAGIPTIHMPRAAATVLEGSGLILWQDDKAFTKNGSKVVMGGGYDEPTMLRSGVWDMWATGEIYVEQSEQIDATEYMLPGQIQTLGEDTALSENTVLTLAERMFRVVVDCYVAHASGTLSAVSGTSGGGGFGA